MALGEDEPVAGARRLPFYSQLDETLDCAKFDVYVERICRKYYAS